MYLLAICMSSLEKCLLCYFSYFLIGLFVFLVLNCMSCLYILEMNPLSVVSFTIIFSHSEGCLFTLFIVSFAVQKLLSLTRSHFFTFVLFPLLQEVGYRGSGFDLCHRVFCLLSSKSFTVSGFIFRSLIHFEFIFVYGVRKCSHFILLHVAVQFSQHHLLKRLSLSPLYILASFVKNKVPIGALVQVWSFYLVPLVNISVFVPVPHCLDGRSFVKVKLLSRV